MANILDFSLTVEGVDVSDITIADVRISVGRKDVWSDVEAGSLSARILHKQTGINGVLTLGKRIQLKANVANSSWILFSGWLTDIQSKTYGWGMWEQSITGVGPLAEFTKLQATDSGWPVETDSQRIKRIIETVNRSAALIGDAQGPLIVSGNPESPEESSAEQSMAEVAASAGGLIFEDHTQGLIGYQPSVQRYGGVEDLWDLIPTAWDDVPGSWNEPELSKQLQTWIIPAHAVLFDPFTWEQHVGDLITYMKVVYGPAVADSERAYVTSGNLDFPAYSDSLDSVLEGQADAQGLADRTIITRGVPHWNAPETRLRVEFMTVEDLNNLLTTKLAPGRPVDIIELPPGSPYADFHGYLEGWEHQISADGDGEWIWEVNLWISDQQLTAPMTTWDQGGVLTWDEIDDPWNTVILSALG